MIALTGALAALPQAAVSADTTNILEKSGIRYPDGFDVNTVGEVRGKVHGLVRPDKGPVMFDLATGADTYTVIAAPSWYWHDLNLGIAEGDEVKVVGSKTVGRDGNLYVVARDIYGPGSSRPVSIRGQSGEAQWRFPGGAGSRGGFGGGASGGGGGGGRGGGFGGGRGGRR